MPPQNDQEQAQPAEFGFMLNQQQPATQQASGGRFSGLSRPAKILLGAVVGLLIAIVAAMVFSGGENNSERLIDLMAQNQEIVRVSQAQDQHFKDENAKGLSATTQAAMNTQRKELGDYLSQANVKYSPQQLNARHNNSTDTQLQEAAQNNSLDDAYIAFLKTSLTTYLNSINETYQSTQSQSLRTTLQSALESVQTLLNAPQLKS